MHLLQEACVLGSFGDFQAHARQKKNKTYILKPESGCQGRGIWITRNPKEIKPHEHMICQVYTSKVSHIFCCTCVKIEQLWLSYHGPESISLGERVCIVCMWPTGIHLEIVCHNKVL